MTYLDELRRIDPAGPADSAAHKRPEAQRLAEQIMAHPVEPATIRRQGSRRILLLAGAAAAAVVGALVFVPGLTGDDAYATWTAVPTPASADVSSAAAEACSMLMGEVNAAAESASGSPTAVPGSSDAEIVEHRGVFTYVVLHSASARAGCLFEGDLEDPTAYSGSLMHVGNYDEPEPDGISAAVLTNSEHDGEHLVFISARSGHLVQGAELHVPGTPEPVHASIDDGILAAWVPSWISDARDITLRLHLADGSSVDLDQEQIHTAGHAD
ncbi:hypothetical protein [Pseudactinotalea sp. Z1748]|uniref:hypothetical protein n=1 Tax=Pseudactinotalea sp. Z1748 TaxID=3413027 RepID=UPI003C7C0FD6